METTTPTTTTKSWRVPEDWTHEDVAAFAVKAAQKLYEEVEATMSEALFPWYEDGDISEANERAAYRAFAMVPGYRREDTGVVTDHGVINTISPDNLHVLDCVSHQDPVIPGVPIYEDSLASHKRLMRYADDYYFEIDVLGEYDEVVFSHRCVIKSPRFSKIVRLYTSMRDHTVRVPQVITL
jgi:hypothetical protein